MALRAALQPRLARHGTALVGAIKATVESGHTPRIQEHVSAWNKSVWLTQEALSDAKFVNQDKMQRQLDALRELYDAVIILDRAAEVQDPPLSVEIMRGQVDVLRQDACHVLNGMAEERRAGRRVDSIDATLEKLRSALEAEDPASLEHEVHSAVAFGLREVRCTLAALIESRNDVAG